MNKKELRDKINSLEQEIQSMFDQKIYLYKGGTIQERNHLRKLVDEVDRLDNELFELILSTKK